MAWKRFFHRKHWDAERASEIATHIQIETDENRARGMSAEAARAAAERKFGNKALVREEIYGMNSIGLLENFVRDVAYGLRNLRRSPGFTTVAVLSLALGIGANTAIFSLMNAVMLKSLPVQDPEQLVLLRYVSKKGKPLQARRTSSGYGATSLSYETFSKIRERSQTFSSVFGFVPLGFNSQSVTVNVNGQPGVAAGEMVTDEYFAGLGVSPILGRTITREDLEPGAPNVAVISYSYWSRQFGRNSSVIGSRIALNGTPFTVAGVTPPEFFGVNPELAPAIWIPLRSQPGLTPYGVEPPPGASMFADRGWWWLMVMARVKPGITREQAHAEAEVIFHNTIGAGLNPPPKPEDLPSIRFIPARQGLHRLRERLSQPLLILMTAVGLVLLIACTNVSTLLLTRAAARQKEMSVRLATGASRGRLIRQLLTESVLLATIGGAIGILFAHWGSRGLLLLMSGQGQSIGLDVHPDAAVLTLSAAVCLVTGILFGLAPAYRATRVDLACGLKAHSGAGSARLGLGGALVAGQVALSLLLLIGAGLFLRTFQSLLNQDLGFDRRNLLLFALDPRRSGYTQERMAAAYQQLLEGIQAVPGVLSATASRTALLTGWTSNWSISTDGPKLAPGKGSNTYWNLVGPAFSMTMGIPIILGRDVEARDLQARRPIVVVNEAMARHFFLNENPLGRRIRFENNSALKEEYEIVGVVGNAKYGWIREQPPATVYLPYTAAAGSLGRMHFEVRTAGDPGALVPVVRQIVRGIDPDLPLIDVKTHDQQIGEALGQELMLARLSGSLGMLALLLVTVGLYGTLGYAVARRTNEIGVRMALGARRAAVVWMIQRQSLILVLAGVAIGLPAALATTRLVATQLYSVRANDPVTFAVAVLILAAAGSAAGYLPARRASRVDPMAALRHE